MATLYKCDRCQGMIAEDDRTVVITGESQWDLCAQCDRALREWVEDGPTLGD